MLQAARLRICTRRLLVCHPPMRSSSCRGRPIPGLQNRQWMIKEELHKPFFLLRHFSSAIAFLKPPFRSLHRLPSASVDDGKRLGQIVGLLVGTSCLSRKQGPANIANFEKDQSNRWPSSKAGRSYQQSRVKRFVERLWVPSLFVLAISLGWHYPLSLLPNLLLLMWSSKPSASSIYSWVEQVRQEEALHATGLDRMKAQAAGVMHVEVHDGVLFSLARVTSLTKISTLLGFLGDWWLLYSSSSAIHSSVKLTDLIPSANPFNRE
ncbi:unnamed protein product [Calypogeia fissa]